MKDHNENCRFSCEFSETIDHLVFDCPHLPEGRDRLRYCCVELGFPFILVSLLPVPRLKILVERSLVLLVINQFTLEISLLIILLFFVICHF